MSQISARMIRRVDAITAYGREAALILVLIYALLTPAEEFLLGRWPLVGMTLVMVAVGVIPALFLLLKAFSHSFAWAFVILDTLYAVGLMLLGKPILGLYAFVPVLVCSARFDWPLGVLDALPLAASYLLIVANQPISRGPIAGLGDILRVGGSHWTYAGSLLLVALFGGQLFEGTKREPPLNADEVQARRQEILRWRTAAERSHAVYELASKLSAALDPGTILGAVLDVCMAGLEDLGGQRGPEPASAGRGSERLPSAVYLYEEEGLYVAAARGIDHRHRDRVVPGKQGLLATVLESGEPVVAGSLADDPELVRYAPMGRCLSAVGVPFCAGSEIFGAIVVGSFAEKAFDAEHVDLLSAVSNQAAVALSNARLYQDLQREKEHILAVEEQTRSKLARDLHDGPTQAVSAIAMRLNYARLLLGQDTPKARDELFKLENLARRTTKDIRTLLFTLRPLVLEAQGLTVALEKLVEHVRETHGLEVVLEIGDLEGQLDMGTQTVAWHVTEECLTNVRKHANARHVTVKMQVRDGSLVTEITDDGDGFDVKSVMDSYDQSTSYGLLGLQERAELVNGRTTIESHPGRGTKVSLHVPLTQEVS